MSNAAIARATARFKYQRLPKVPALSNVSALQIFVLPLVAG
jgi:hypothetical protein